MRIYFENGGLIAKDIAGVPEDAIYIDANDGVTSNLLELDMAQIESKNKAVIYTNQILAFDNKYGWDDNGNHVNIFIRYPSIVFGGWKRIDKLTERIIRYGNNVGKLYIAGEFSGI